MFNKSLRKIFALAALSYFLCSHTIVMVMAQERDSVVYGSTKVQDTLTQSMVSANGWKSPMISSAPLATIGRESISMASSIDIGDVIKRFAGANVKDYGGIGGLKTVSVRSLGAQHTAVTYDGAPVSNAQSGQIDISRFGTENVESVSFQIGQGNDIFIPAILLNAAGVLSISNMMPKFEDGKRFAFNGKVAYGSFKTFEAGLKLSHSISKGWSADIMGDFLTSDGSYPFSIPNAKEEYNAVRNNSDIKSYRIEGNLFGFDGRLRAKVYYHGSERGLPGSVVLYNPISNERLRDKSAIAQISYGNNIGEHVEIKGVAKYSFDWARYTDTSEQYPGGKIDDVYDQREGYGSIAVKYMPIKSLSLALAQDISYNTLKASISACPDPSRISFYTSLGASWEMKRFSITATLLNVVMREKVAYGNPAPARNRLSPSVSASVKPFSDIDLRFRLSFRDGYRIPTFNDLYYARVGNKSLEPEKAKQYNAGITFSSAIGEGNSIAATVDYYHNDVRDKIVAIPTLFIWKMLNMGKVATDGVDAGISAYIFIADIIKMDISAAYSFQHAIDVTNPDSKTYRHQIPYTPRHSGNASLTLLNKWVNLNYSLIASGRRYALGQNIKSNLIAPYMDHSLNIYRTFDIRGCSITLLAGIKNIGNVNYQIVKNYPMAGRSYRISITVNI